MDEHKLTATVNVIIVVGSPGITAELSRKFSTERTSLGEPISVVPIDKSDGVVVRDEVFLQHVREAAIKEYFFGDTKRTLSPLIQQVDFDNVVLYHTPEGNNPLCLLENKLTDFSRKPSEYCQGRSVYADAALDACCHARCAQGCA